MNQFVVNTKQGTFFGDLENVVRLNHGHKDHPSYNMRPGNYVVSLIKSEHKSISSLIVIHHENVDANFVQKILLEIGDYSADSELPPSSKKPRLFTGVTATRTSNDWFPLRHLWPKTSQNFDSDDYTEHLAFCVAKIEENVVCSMCRNPLSEIAFVEIGNWRMHLFEKIYEAHLRFKGDTTHPVRFSRLIYFLNNKSWLRQNYTQIRVTQIDARCYKFEVYGKALGIAVDPYEIDQGNGFHTATLQDENGWCYAHVIQATPEQVFREYYNQTLSVSMDQVLFDSPYRCYKNSLGQCQENPVYGENSVAVGISQLPEEIIVKIFSYLPWNERARCRRVNRAWLSAGDASLIATTPSIDRNDPKFVDMEQCDFERLIPLVANRVVSIDLAGITSLNFLSHLENVDSFLSLRKLDGGGRAIIEENALFAVLDKCPNLKELYAWITWKSSNVTGPVKEYGLEKIDFVNRHQLIDPDLISIADHFPKLTEFKLTGYNYLSNSCLSSFAERYGNQLTRLEINLTEDDRENVRDGAIGVFTGIQVCGNLEHLSLSFSSFVSDAFMHALASGCPKLTTLNLMFAFRVTNAGLSALVRLPNLKRLNVDDAGVNCSDGIMNLAYAGHLEELIVTNCDLSPAAFKACIRYCPGLKLLDAEDYDLTADDAEEIVKLYGRHGRVSCLILRPSEPVIWRGQGIRAAQEEVKQGTLGHRGRFLIDCRSVNKGLWFDEKLANNDGADIYVNSEDEDSDATENWEDADSESNETSDNAEAHPSDDERDLDDSDDDLDGILDQYDDYDLYYDMYFDDFE